MLNKDARKNWLSMANRDFARKVTVNADNHLGHLFALSEFDVLKVLLALAHFCEHEGKEIGGPEVLANELEWHEAATGFKFVMWAM